MNVTALTDIRDIRQAVDTFMQREQQRENPHCAYHDVVKFIYRDRAYELQQTAFRLADGSLRYQHYITRDGRLLHFEGLRQALSDMKWDCRYTNKAEALYG